MTDTEKMQTLSVVRGVLDELHSCRDAGRSWTGNWNSAMVNRVQRRSDTDHITKKFCRKLRRILLEMYSIIAQGAGDIMDIRHGIKDVQDAQRAAATIAPPRLKGQTDIRDWLIDSSGLSGQERRERMTNL